MGEGTDIAGLLLADQLRQENCWLRVQTHCGGGSFKSQMKKADKSGARFALLLGESELAAQQITIKDLRTDAEQQTVAIAGLCDWLADNML
jgi:histidyl-tRNA synthetase